LEDEIGCSNNLEKHIGNANGGVIVTEIDRELKPGRSIEIIIVIDFFSRV